MKYDLSNLRIYVAGHRGMVGSAIVRNLESKGCDVLTVSRDNLDLMDQEATQLWLSRNRPDAVVLAAAKVGGILANDSFPADFLYQNTMIACNVIDGAHRADINRVLFLGSSCIYPKFASQPIREDSLLTSSLEPTNEWYALAKIVGVKMCEAYRRQYGRDYISAMPTNLYGHGDNFDLQTSHVLPALIRKVHEAKLNHSRAVTIWGSGSPRREFLYADDCADACAFLLQEYSEDQHINVGYGSDISILELAHLVCKIVEFDGEIVCDTSKPDGTPRKLMDVQRLQGLGWSPSVSLEEGIKRTYQWFVDNYY